MKLSIWIFADWLKEYNPKLQITSGKPDIEAVRLFSEKTVFDKNTLYIGRLDDFFRNGEKEILCAHNNDYIILPTEDKEEILNSILKAQEFYAKWNTDMLQMLSGDCMVDDLLHRAEKVIFEPLFILDSSQRLMALSSCYPLHSVDRQWDLLLTTGQSDLSFIMNLNAKYPERLHQKGLYESRDDLFPSHCYGYNFFLNDQRVGNADIIDLHHNLSQGQMELFLIFCGYIQKWFEAHAQQQSALFLDTLFHSSILGQECDYETFNYNLSLIGWKEGDHKCIITLQTTSDHYNIHLHLCKILAEALHSVFAVTHNDSIYMLCNLSMKSLPNLQKELTPWLQHSGYYGCFSESFTELDFITEGCRQTSITAQFCEKNTGKLYNYQDFSLRYGFTVMQQNAKTNFVHPAVLDVLKYDSEHHTKYSKTLYTYLRNERSQSKTAAALHLHRNTLTYRLAKLKELVSYDLEDADVRLHILISYEFLLTNRELNLL